LKEINGKGVLNHEAANHKRANTDEHGQKKWRVRARQVLILSVFPEAPASAAVSSLRQGDRGGQ
jgi:hypothetical protein